MSGDRSPMSNEKLPNGASTALHQGRWSWRGGSSRQMLKTASQATHLCSWVPSMAWSIQTLQQVEACESGTKRGVQRENREGASQRQIEKEESRGFVRLLTPDTETKTFSPPRLDHTELKPKAALQWQRRQRKARTNLHGNSPFAIILLVSLQLYSSRGLSLSISIQV